MTTFNKIGIVMGGVLLVIVAAALASPSTPAPAPAPTPQIITKTVEVPGPTIEVTPAVCIDALNEQQVLLVADNNLIGGFVAGTVTSDSDPLAQAFINASSDEKLAKLTSDVADCVASAASTN